MGARKRDATPAANLTAISDVDDGTARLARSLMEARRPKAPKGPPWMHREPEFAIRRAKAGDVGAARALLAIGAASLRQRAEPLEHVVLIPRFLAEYLASALDSIVRGVDPGRALNVKRKAHRDPFANEYRDAMMAYAHASFVSCGNSKDAATSQVAEMLDRLGVAGPRGASWDLDTVRSALEAHAQRNK